MVYKIINKMILSILLLKGQCTKRKLYIPMTHSDVSCMKLYDPKLSTINYRIELYKENEDDVISKEKICNKSLNDHEIYTMDMYNEGEIEEFIKKLKKNSNINYKITFSFTENKKELLCFIKYFLYKLEENQICKVEIFYEFDKKCTEYYTIGKFYAEKHKEDLVIYRTCISKYKYRNLEENRIDRQLISNLIKDNANLYMKVFTNGEDVSLFHKYFLNSELFYLYLDLMKKEAEILDHCELESETWPKGAAEKIPKMISLHLLFYFFKNSCYLSELIRKFLQMPDKSYCVFDEILSDLKIDKNFFKTEGCYTLEGTFVSLKDSFIFERMKNLKFGDNVKGYKKLLIFFYLYLNLNHESFVSKVIKIIEDFVITNKFKDQNLTILKKIISLLSDDLNVSSKSFINNFLQEREEIYLPSSSSQE